MRWCLLLLVALGCDEPAPAPVPRPAPAPSPIADARPVVPDPGLPAEAPETAEAPIDAAVVRPPELALELGETRASGRMQPGFVRAILRGRREALFECYERSGSQRPLTLRVRLTIGDRALVTSLHIVKRSGARPFDRCVAALLRRVSFGIADAGRVEQTLTIRRGPG